LSQEYFQFVYAGQNGDKNGSCDLLTDAFDRYFKIIFKPAEYEIVSKVKSKAKKIKRKASFKKRRSNGVVIEKINIVLNGRCESYPTLESDESCKFFLYKKKEF
jgi:hypothetical protein